MIITEISKQRKKGRYNIFVDGEFFSGIDALSLLQAGLKEGKEITREELEQKVTESECRSAFDYLGKYLAAPHTKKQVNDKLKQRGYSDNVIALTIEKAESYGYLNDEEYARALVSSLNLKSRREVKSKLMQKGIDRQTIDLCLSSISQDDENSRAQVLSEKYLKNKDINQKTLSGLYQYLLRKGFDGEVAMQAVTKYKGD